MTNLQIASVAPLRSCRPSKSTPLMRVYAENGMKVASCFGNVTAAQAVLLFRQHDDGAAFGRLIGKAGKLRRVGQFLVRDAVDRQ